MTKRKLRVYARKIGGQTAASAVAEIEASPGFNARAVDFLRRLSLVFQDSSYGELFFRHISKQGLAELLNNPPVSNYAFETLYGLDLLPTPSILAGVQDGFGRDGLERVMEYIKNGGFDPASPLHVELEYSRYVQSGTAPEIRRLHENLSIEDFVRLPWREDKNTIIGRAEEAGVEATAREAAAVYELIRSKVNADIPLLVIGNMRYGGLFVIKPIEDALAEIGVKVVYEYVKSTDYDRIKFRNVPGHLSDSTWKWIANNQPNIIVVDGTTSTKILARSGQVLARFPSAMWGYVIAFKEFDTEHDPDFSRCPDSHHEKLKRLPASPGYRVSLWAPELTEKAHFGDYEFVASPNNAAQRELTIVCSTSSEPGGSRGVFDNPDEYIAYKVEACLSPHGFSYARIETDLPKFISTIQQAIRDKATGYIGKEQAF